MQVVILCGGEGIRFRNYIEDIPKVLAKIGDMPILWHIMKYYQSFGHQDFILCLGSHHDQVKEIFENIDEEWSVTMVDTGERTPTGGRVKLIEKYVRTDDFFVTYGDGLSNVNLETLLNFHVGHGQIATMTAVRPHNQYGIIDLDASDSVINFKEKPRMTHYVNGGFFVFNKRIFSHLGLDENIETSLFMELVTKRELKAYTHTGFWKSMDTFKENMELNDLWISGKADWVNW